MGKWVRQNKGATFFLSVRGHELVGGFAGLLLQSGIDWALPYYRDRACAVGLGASLAELLASFLARDIPNHSGGRMMPEHFSDPALRIPCQSSCVGSQFLQAVGVAKSVQLRGAKEVVYVSGGDGSTSQGDFHEALNFAALHRLPIIFVIQDNGWAISVPVEEQTAGGCSSHFGSNYVGLECRDIDGCDPAEVGEIFSQAIERARSGEGPTLIVAHVPRLGPHSSSDDPKKYREEEDSSRDPIPRLEEWLLSQGILTEEEVKEARDASFQEVEEAGREAESFPFPDVKTVTDHLFKSFVPSSPSTEETLSSESVVIMDALNHALVEEMERDAGVIVFGQDVAKGKGGVFGITRRLTERFGSLRCFNTPLAESTIVGLAIGLSFDGFHKPVAEIQFADYSWTGMNQLLNELASIHYRSNGAWHCPVVIRMPYGGYIQGGPYHSQSIEAFLCHAPGLKVVIPSNASDAKRLLKMAIRDPNPVIFLEHKALYRQRLFSARPEPGKEDLLPFGQAISVREGSDITLVAWGMMVGMGVEVAGHLAAEGISVEVIDLRTLSPLDFQSIANSVKKTGKCLILHEAPRTCGFGAELAARLAEECFSFLDAPVVRVTGKDCPVPYCKLLEEAVLPQSEDVKAALRQLAAY
ncbi:MAG: MFS transporter [Verrucomicrobiota bacterium]|nr:MFS transporter [Verrucomicrobiota bacterium]